MVEVRKVDRSMFSQVYPLLLEFDNQQLTREDWRRFYDYPWSTDEGYCGYALLDGEAVVGFIAMIFSERLINGQIERFCNLANWIVRDEYRGQSLALLLPALKLAGYTLSDFTPSAQVREISQRLGFRQLDARLKLLLPMPRLPFGGRADGWFALLLAPTEVTSTLMLEIPILAYHRIVADDEPGELSRFSVTRTQFESQMRYLHEQHYHCVAPPGSRGRYYRKTTCPAKVVCAHF